MGATAGATEPFVSPTPLPERPFNGRIDRSPAKTTGVHSSHGITFGQPDNRSRGTPSYARSNLLTEVSEAGSGHTNLMARKAGRHHPVVRHPVAR